MKTISTTVIFALLATISFGQTLIPEALIPTEHNVLGDPITNIIDPDGARQGDWTYQDVDGKLIIKEHYENHILKNTYYSTLNSDGTLNWKISTESNTNPGAAEKLKNVVVDKYNELSDNQQVVIIVDEKGKMTRFAALGVWNSADVQEVEQIVREFLKNNHKIISDETFILL